MRRVLLLLILAACGKPDPAPADRGPRVVATVPADGAVGVSAQTVVRVTFDQPIDDLSLTADSFAISPEVGGQLGWDGPSRTASFTPDGPLADGQWTVDLSAEITSPQGLSILPHSFGFAVGAGTGTGTGGSLQWSDGVDTTTLAVADPDTLQRSYTMSSTHPQRDGWPQEVGFEELPGQPVLRSGSLFFDALFALAVHESRLLSVAAINDGAFSGGSDVPCDCFQTGAEWHYVWTRDTAYAVDLGLALLDPDRAANSLAFKVSADKAAVGAGGLQIVQDTGTGGSWPVSTDRVVWAFGADRVLAVLDGPDRTAFRDLTLEAAVNTAEVDRLHVWDAADGLYRGETSFLDWREQTYPQWTASDVRHIAESKSLSTNMGHYKLLDLASRLSAEVGDGVGEARYRGWADQLAADIDAGFWIDGEGWARVLPNQLDPAPLAQFDWLGTSLAALELPAAAHAELALSTYPQGPYGPAVIWPQQPMVPIYHNRAAWPFVTAYGVRAGVAHGNDALVTAGVDALTTGTLRNLSNMENFEVLTGANWLDDGPWSGPTVNSHYQLWSVAGYAGMVFDLLGVRPEADGLHLEPFIPAEVADAWLPGPELALHQISYKGRTFDLVLERPASATGPLVASSIAVDGSPATSPLDAASIPDGAEVRVVLVDGGSTGASITAIVDDGDFTKLFAPRDPAVLGLGDVGGQLELTLDDGGEAGVVFDVLRDGVAVATGVSGPTWVDPGSTALASTSYCYAVSTRFTGSGHVSQRSQPVCWWGASGERVQLFDAFALTAEGATWNGGADPFWSDWGNADTAAVTGLRPNWTGPHLIQVVHANGSGPISTGLTAGHKWLTVRDPAGAVAAEGALVFPQSGDWTAFRDSTGLVADLQAGVSYSLELSDTATMSWLDHFSIYTAGSGGGPDAFNQVDLRAVKLLPLSGVDQTPTTGSLVAFDGVDDLAKLGPAQQLAFGATLQPWEAFGLTWDADHLYLAWVSEAFEGDYRPLVLYLEATVGAPGPAAAATGFEYDLLLPELPFTPTHAVSLRKLSDDGAVWGPWDGVRVPDGPAWRTTRRFARDRDSYLAADSHTLSVRVPRSALGDPTHLRLVGHVVNAAPGVEWVDTLPASHSPWTAGGGGYLELDLSGATEAVNWVER